MAPVKKRSRKVLTIKEKTEILDEISKGKTDKALAVKYGVGRTTISDIKKQKLKIQSFIQSTETGSLKRKSLRHGEYPELERSLYSWFSEQRHRHLPVSKELLCEKAKQIFQNLREGGDKTFNASNGWFENFKRRFGIRLLKISGEKLSNASELVGPFKLEFQRKVRKMGLVPDQIYNADESGLFWKILPDTTFVGSREATAPGRKTSKERITFLACANNSGSHKLKLLVIGKARNPRALKNQQIPVNYQSTNKAWMTSSLFKEWFHKDFVPEVRNFLAESGLPLKALLVLDNAPSHPPVEELTSDDQQITTMFIPPNCTALVQPMDQNAIRLTKLHYKKSLLSHIVAANESDISQCLKKINLKHAVTFLANAWDKLTPSTLKNCWHVLPCEDWDSDDDLPLSEYRHLRRREEGEIEEDLSYVRTLLNAIGPGDVTNEEVNSWIAEDLIAANECNQFEGESSDSEGFIENVEPRIKHQSAIEALNISIKWAEQNNASFEQILSLRQLSEEALKLCSLQKQLKITSFFSTK